MIFVAHSLGRRVEYKYEIVAWAPGERPVMRTADGPFPMKEGTGRAYPDEECAS
jgi:hypothetical protein